MSENAVPGVEVGAARSRAGNADSHMPPLHVGGSVCTRGFQNNCLCRAQHKRDSSRAEGSCIWGCSFEKAFYPFFSTRAWHPLLNVMAVNGTVTGL